MSHPIDPDREGTREVFAALLETLPEADRAEWRRRWLDARNVERRRRDYDREWDQSLLGVTRFGQ